ncbi:unnamed protein product, partial [Ectocarpus sp. 12 AP-2014]
PTFPHDPAPSLLQLLPPVDPLLATTLKEPLVSELVKGERGEADEKHAVHDGHEHAHRHDPGDLVVDRPAGHRHQRGAPREGGVRPEGRIPAVFYQPVGLSVAIRFDPLLPA